MNTSIFKAIRTHSNTFFLTFTILKNDNAFPVEAWAEPEGSRISNVHKQQMKAARFSTHSTDSAAGWKTDEPRFNFQQGYQSLYLQRIQTVLEVHSHSYSMDIRTHSSCGRAVGV